MTDQGHPSLGAVDLEALLLRIQNPPTPTDGPEFHAEYAFWLEGIRRDVYAVKTEVALARENCAAAFQSASEWEQEADQAKADLSALHSHCDALAKQLRKSQGREPTQAHRGYMS